MYAGLKADSLTKSSTADYRNFTAGELKAEVNKAKKEPRVVNCTATTTAASYLNANVVNFANVGKFAYAVTPTKSKTLSCDFVVGAATITFHAVGHYTRKTWTSASASPADVDSDFLIYTYKLAKQKNSTSCTSSCITLKNSGDLETYLGIANIGLVKIATQQYKNSYNFNASKYL
jgi:hypothetical protein